MLFTVAIPGTVGIYLPLWIGRQAARHTGVWNWLAYPLLAAGIAVLLLCVRDFATKGEGTPFPLDPPQNLVTGRLYAFSRNPMYLGVLTTIAGWVLWYSTVLIAGYWLLVFLLFSLFVVKVEEPGLKKQFGSAYEAYCKRVPRWI
ncbi:MAG: isoprenylcysteine carboxylmethyltransferase family protein [Lewinellaceae bacterium]|nr:isoprenylcysteine carboxylmethyltransferase family protein [Lewinellaceae bacterium]